jgi:hypothetical protein
MRNALLVIFLSACGTSGTGGDDTLDPDAAVTDDGSTGTDGSMPDSPSVSYAPCATCCDPIAQTGCGTGEACYHNESTQLTYCAVVGTSPNVCNNDSDCMTGLDCTYPSQTHKCRKFCTTNADCLGSGMTQCVFNNAPPQNPYGVCF